MKLEKIKGLKNVNETMSKKIYSYSFDNGATAIVYELKGDVYDMIYNHWNTARPTNVSNVYLDDVILMLDYISNKGGEACETCRI